MLGSLHMDWALHESDAVRKMTHAQKAAAWFAEAIKFEPRAEFIWRESVFLQRVVLNNTAEADRQEAVADGLMSDEVPLDCGEYYSQRCRTDVHPDLKQYWFGLALRYYGAAAQAENPAATRFAGVLGKAKSALFMSDFDQALRWGREALSMASPMN